ncbi:hypothetical protein [Lyngbya sp. CCY1209]|nr:hypothetical protein [Lyngbya sp. CCY1209]
MVCQFAAIALYPPMRSPATFPPPAKVPSDSPAAGDRGNRARHES